MPLHERSRRAAKGFAILSFLAIASALLWRFRSGDDGAGPFSKDAEPPAASRNSKDWLTLRERAVEEGDWSKELLAQRCAATIEELWDAVKRRTNALEILARFNVGEVALGRWESSRALANDIRVFDPGGEGARITPKDWRSFVTRWVSKGWALASIEFRHTRFDVTESGAPRESRFAFSAQLTRGEPAARAVLAGDLKVQWAGRFEGTNRVGIRRIDASGLQILVREGEPPFQPWAAFEMVPPRSCR